MRLTTNWGLMIGLFLSYATSCDSIQYKKFNKEIWLKNNSERDRNNPRSHMTKDLLENYLQVGITKAEILDLLGPPQFDGISQRIQKGATLPDSISLSHSRGKSKEERQISMDKFNAWLSEHREPDTILLYPVGWSMIDLVSLLIRLNDHDIAYEFNIIQH